MKNGKVYMKHNSLGDDVPIVVILRAMGATSDQEIVQLVSRRAPAGHPQRTSIFGFGTRRASATSAVSPAVPDGVLHSSATDSLTRKARFAAVVLCICSQAGLAC